MIFYSLDICHSSGVFYLFYCGSINILPRWGLPSTFILFLLPFFLIKTFHTKQLQLMDLMIKES
jgi:hypothetical protein